MCVLVSPLAKSRIERNFGKQSYMAVNYLKFYQKLVKLALNEVKLIFIFYVYYYYNYY